MTDQDSPTDMPWLNEKLETSKVEKGKMYLRLFCERDYPDDQMYDWGFDGPTFGPLLWAHTTCLRHFRVAPENGDEGFEVMFHNDLIKYKEKFYGDWSVYIAQEAGASV